MITTRIDWAGAAGQAGRVYAIGWDAEDERPYDPSSGFLAFEKPDGTQVCLSPKKVRVQRIQGLRLPLRACQRIARQQVEAGYIRTWQYKEIMDRLEKMYGA